MESRHRIVCGHYLARGLDAGRHMIELRCNPVHALLFFTARRVHVEVLAL